MGTQCARHQFKTQKRQVPVQVGKVRYLVDGLNVRVCELCGQERISGEELMRAEVSVANRMASSGAYGSAAFRFMRKAIGIKSVELAQLLGVEPETVTRWEKGTNKLDQRAAALLEGLVLDYVAGTEATRNRLKALAANVNEAPGQVAAHEEHVAVMPVMWPVATHG